MPARVLGTTALATMLSAGAARLEPPLVSGNLDLGGNAALRAEVEDHLVLDAGGRQIGIVSAMATDTDETSSPGETVVFHDEIDAVQTDVDALTEMGVDIVVGLPHVGGRPPDRRGGDRPGRHRRRAFA